MIQLPSIGTLRLHTCSAIIAAMLVAAGCTDDSLLTDSGPATGHPEFSVGLMSAWTVGSTESRSSGTCIAIDSMDGETPDGKKLYLVTEQAAINDSLTAHDATMSRGSMIESVSNFPESFGLSAICYVGAEGSDLSDYTTNFAHNIEITQKGARWEPKSQELEWPGSGHIRFMAYAPYGNSGITHASDTPVLNYTVNSDITKQIDLLTATADCSGAGSPAVNLQFGHPLSAIIIKAGTEMLAGTITRITLSGIKGSGSLDMRTGKWDLSGQTADATYDIKFADSDGSVEENPDKGANYPYVKPGTDIAGNDDGLTLLMIPQELTDKARLTMEFTDKLTETTRTLSATIGGSGKAWQAGSQYTYSISTTGTVFTPVVKLVKHGTADVFPIDSIPFSGSIRNVDLTAYMSVLHAGETTPVDLEIPVKIYSSTDNGVSWQQGLWEPNTPSEHPDYDGSPKAVKAKSAQTGSLHVQPQSVFASMKEKFPASASETGSDKDWKDLSEIYGETANCYMINKPGYYCFPLVYGNGLKGGAENPDAYTINRGQDTDTDKAEPGMLHFVDHNDKKITTPYIENQVGASTLGDAFILWQDSPGLIDLVEKTVIGGQSRIRFRVSRHTMVQGNAVIALLDTSGTIVWSWHIWVTDCDSNSDIFTTTTVPIPPATAGNQYTFLNSTLGYCDAHPGNAKRSIKLKFVFDLKDINGKEIEVTEIDGHKLEFGQQEIIASLAGDNTYYQWGRKDPMAPGVYESDFKYYHTCTPKDDGTLFDPNEFTMTNKPVFDERDGYRFGRSSISGGVYLWQSIQYPHHFIMGKDNGAGDVDSNPRKHWHPSTLDPKPTYITEGCMYNAWNTTARHLGQTTVLNTRNDQHVTKSVYDPCPPGFHVPASHAFTGMVSPDVAQIGSAYYANRDHPLNPVTWDNSTRSWNLKANADGSGASVRIHATGVRDINVSATNEKYIPDYLSTKTWPGYSMITFICTSTIATNHQTHIFFFDNRSLSYATPYISNGSCRGSNNSYGFTVWPVRND